MMSNATEGGCLCGAIRYRATGAHSPKVSVTVRHAGSLAVLLRSLGDISFERLRFHYWRAGAFSFDTTCEPNILP
jgi:hypothetical protein